MTFYNILIVTNYNITEIYKTAHTYQQIDSTNPFTFTIIIDNINFKNANSDKI